MEKLIKNDYIKDGQLNIFLLGEVDTYNGDVIADRVFNAQNDPNIQEIVIHINSAGGSIINGLSLVGAIYDSEKPVIAINEGAALSMAAIIFISAHKRLMRDYAVLMLHDPSIWGQRAEDFEEGSPERRALESLKQTLVQILNSNSNLTKQKLEKLLNEETWIDAQTAKEYGFVDEIIKSRKKVAATVENINEFVAKCNAVIKDEYHLLMTDDIVINNKINTQQTENQKIELAMIKNFKSVLDLPDNASDGDVLEKVVQIKNELTSTKDKLQATVKELEQVKNELKTIKTKAEEQAKKYQDVIKAKDEQIKALENRLNEFNSKFAEELVDNAIKEGKINKDNRDEMIAFAKESPEKFKKFLDAIPMRVMKKDIKQELKNSDTQIDERSKWTYEDWSKKDPEGLRELMHKDPEKFNKLLDDYTKSIA